MLNEDQATTLEPKFRCVCTWQEWEQVAALAGPRGFSCNEFGEVWRRTGRGYLHANKRAYVQRRSRLLDWCVAAVLAHYRTGKCFTVCPTGVHLADALTAGQRVAELVFAETESGKSA